MIRRPLTGSKQYMRLSDMQCERFIIIRFVTVDVFLRARDVECQSAVMSLYGTI